VTAWPGFNAPLTEDTEVAGAHDTDAGRRSIWIEEIQLKRSGVQGIQIDDVELTGPNALASLKPIDSLGRDKVILGIEQLWTLDGCGIPHLPLGHAFKGLKTIQAGGELLLSENRRR
jgi:hypothetical protein